MSWYQKNAKRWYNEQQIAGEALGNVHSHIVNGLACIDGALQVVSTHGYVYEEVELRIEYPYRFPHRNVPPTVYLISHRDIWKRAAEAHINTDWSLCLFVPGDSGLDFSKDDSLYGLLAIAQTFLFKEWKYQKAILEESKGGEKATWLGEARPHFTQGIKEVIKERSFKPDDACPCGSGKSFKVCCNYLKVK